MSSSTKQFMKKITPECETMAKRTMTLNSISVFFSIVAVILLIVALVYIYMPAEDATTMAKNKQVAGITSIFALLSVLVALVVSIWQIMISGKLKSCIEKAPSTM
jgi:hypothetical protein